MRARPSAILLVCLGASSSYGGRADAGDLRPYPLPDAVGARIKALAAGGDVLVLGEVHGTREVPELAAGLLPPLAELGYRTLALEIPNRDQAALRAWARGETETIPDFFARPNGDGIGNAHLLALARVAASPPFRWQIVCFDDSKSLLGRLASLPKGRDGKADGPRSASDYGHALWRERDAEMASILRREAGSLGAPGKILAVCGNLHARTANDLREPALSPLWPSFAARLKEGPPAWQVPSVNVEFCGGTYFNNGKVQTFRKRPLERPEVRSEGLVGWDLELSLPAATSATLLGPGPASEGKAADGRPAKAGRE